jgi:hypothetical protein
MTAELTGVLWSPVTWHLDFHGYDMRKYGKKRAWFVSEVTTSYHGNACENQNKVRIDSDWSLLRHLGWWWRGQNSVHVYYTTPTQSQEGQF